MPLKTEGSYPNEFLVTELPGTMSRDRIILAQSATVYPTGAVLGQVTATKKYVVVNPAASDGSQTAVAVLRAARDATAGDVAAVAYTRLTEVNASEINFGALTAPQIVVAKAQLYAATVFPREAV